MSRNLQPTKRKLELKDLEYASMRMKTTSMSTTNAIIFSFSTENTHHGLFLIESQEMTCRD